MNITKEMGRACLKAVGNAPCWHSASVSGALVEMGMGWTYGDGAYFSNDDYLNPSLHADLAYLLAAEIAGVRGKR